MRNIKVWGGTHPDELLPLALAHSLMDDPIPGVESGIVNVFAEQQGKRFIDVNMNNGYPGDSRSDLYEERRAVEVLQDCQRPDQPYDAIFDMHAINGIGEDAAFIGSKGVSPEVLGFLKQLGIVKVLLTDFNNMLEHTHNAVGTESVRGGMRSDVGYWRDAFSSLVNKSDFSTADPRDFNWFRYTDGLHISQADPQSITADTDPGARVPAFIEKMLGHTEPQYWFGRHLQPNEAGYWAELCTPVAVPDMSGWPL